MRHDGIAAVKREMNECPQVDLHREATAKVAPKPPATHKIVGKSIPRFDIPNKVTGGIAYVQDMRLPGMVHGRIVRPPTSGL
jgi:nicotinate dehydrogenase subunit B